ELGQAIATLGRRDQDLLYFKYFLELPNSEICTALGISEASIRPLLYRARKRALRALEGRAER
ncbi:RNA polymerase sigma factor, partial [Harryflintia acetispora]|uniref:RNA polymerase sigma factor n=1 Tax=Harryflintia acetispora TaxID=1849041 RepID=UPI001899D537